VTLPLLKIKRFLFEMSRNLNNIARQQGFLIPLALFILVGMAALAAAVARISSQSNTQSYQELISTQAFFAADSGAQLAMNRVMFPSASRSAGDAACNAMLAASSTIFSCEVNLSCSIAADSASSISVYTVSSTATCGSGDLAAVRTVQGSAFLRDE
jgi:MSHA biogenesis protein MshP